MHPDPCGDERGALGIPTSFLQPRSLRRPDEDVPFARRLRRNDWIILKASLPQPRFRERTTRASSQACRRCTASKYCSDGDWTHWSGLSSLASRVAGQECLNLRGQQWSSRLLSYSTSRHSLHASHSHCLHFFFSAFFKCAAEVTFFGEELDLVVPASLILVNPTFTSASETTDPHTVAVYLYHLGGILPSCIAEVPHISS